MRGEKGTELWGYLRIADRPHAFVSGFMTIYFSVSLCALSCDVFLFRSRIQDAPSTFISHLSAHLQEQRLRLSHALFAVCFNFTGYVFRKRSHDDFSIFVLHIYHVTT